MKRNFFAIGCLLLIGACGQKETKPDQQAALSQDELIKRGAYLVTISGCNDCHSPKVMTPNGPESDPQRLLSGHPQDEQLPPIPKEGAWVSSSMGLTAWVGPWGMSFAANLTPDDTGLGSWSFEQFKTAMRKGKFKGLEGSRPLLPPMPWQNFQHMTDDDLQAVFTYLQSIKPIKNLVPAAVSPADLIANK